MFSNTGMELSDTLKAVDAAKRLWPNLRFEEAKCHMKPTDSWDEFGPPGRRMRWCCVVHKSVPTIIKLRRLLVIITPKLLYLMVLEQKKVQEEPNTTKEQRTLVR